MQRLGFDPPLGYRYLGVNMASDSIPLKTEVQSEHICILLHELKQSRRSCPRRVNASSKTTPSMYHPRRRNVTTSMVGLRNGHIHKNLAKIGKPLRYSLERRRRSPKTVQLQKQTGSMNHRFYPQREAFGHLNTASGSNNTSVNYISTYILYTRGFRPNDHVDCQ